MQAFLAIASESRTTSARTRLGLCRHLSCHLSCRPSCHPLQRASQHLASASIANSNPRHRHRQLQTTLSRAHRLQSTPLEALLFQTNPHSPSRSTQPSRSTHASLDFHSKAAPFPSKTAPFHKLPQVSTSFHCHLSCRPSCRSSCRPSCHLSCRPCHLPRFS